MLPSKKGPHYHNILEVDAQGQPLATISAKRARWYLQRNLAAPLPAPPGYSGCIQLTFKPKGGPESPQAYRVRPNICVVCGKREHLTRHHVIPRIISRNFPLADKEHQSRFCVLLCQVHHREAEKILYPHLTGTHLWLECQTKVKVVGNKSASALLALRNSGRLTALQNSHPARIEQLCLDAGLTRLPQSSSEWVAIEANCQRQILEPPSKDFAPQFICQHGGVEAVQQFFWSLFLQLSPKFI
jgi:hypothetical protein